MVINHLQYKIEILDVSNYTLNSVNTVFNYEKIYFKGSFND